MRKTLAGLAATALLLTGCQSEPTGPAGPEPLPTDATAAPTSPAVSPEGPTAPEEASDLVIGFGSLGPATIGMSKDDALETGAFKAGNPAPVDGCPEPPLMWKPQFDGVDVLTKQDGTIAALGVFDEGPKTEAGIGVGSTLAEVKEAYSSDLTGPAEAGYGQSGAYVNEEDEWIGFLFDPALAQLEDESPVTFIEVSNGGKPDLMRDGC